MGLAVRICAFVVAAAVFCLFYSGAAGAQDANTFSSAGDRAIGTLLGVYYGGDGSWRKCSEQTCDERNSDWGADAATYTLYLRWSITHDPQIRGVMAAIAKTAPQYPQPCAAAPCPAWSDTPAWDAVAFMREYEVLGDDPQSLQSAKDALAYVERSKAFARGACPQVPYQWPHPANSSVKTLETDANAVKADLLVYQATQDRGYLDDALSRYAADRTYFFDAQAGLYTVHIKDDGRDCTQVPRRFFASVNGDMIWNGIELWRITGQQHFYDEALATAHSVDAHLSDASGVFADLQGENDVVEPLVEAMYDLAAGEHVQFAAGWVLRNATAALSARAPDGTFSRFFDGPPQAVSSIWESNGGLALEIAAAALEPDEETPDRSVWQGDGSVNEQVQTLPAEISFNGSGIALVGTISKACTSAHLRVFVDGVETFDQTGLWQNYSMPDGHSVFFAWRWPKPGHHTIELRPGDPAQDGTSLVDLKSVVLPVTSPGPAGTAVGS